ncbi:suppressor of lurcher protein 1, partial [Caerostris extrusa]
MLIFYKPHLLQCISLSFNLLQLLLNILVSHHGINTIHQNVTSLQLRSSGCYNDLHYYRWTSRELDNYCGNKLPTQLMSNGPTMEIEFRTYHSSPEVKGFRALYRFVTDFGISSVGQNPTLDCRFMFLSEERGNGTFSSPNYPGYYPRDTECHYTFRGKEKRKSSYHLCLFRCGWDTT